MVKRKIIVISVILIILLQLFMPILSSYAVSEDVENIENTVNENIIETEDLQEDVTDEEIENINNTDENDDAKKQNTEEIIDIETEDNTEELQIDNNEKSEEQDLQETEKAEELKDDEMFVEVESISDMPLVRYCIWWWIWYRK